MFVQAEIRNSPDGRETSGPERSWRVGSGQDSAELFNVLSSGWTSGLKSSLIPPFLRCQDESEASFLILLLLFQKRQTASLNSFNPAFLRRIVTFVLQLRGLIQKSGPE